MPVEPTASATDQVTRRSKHAHCDHRRGDRRNRPCQGRRPRDAVRARAVAPDRPAHPVAAAPLPAHDAVAHDRSGAPVRLHDSGLRTHRRRPGPGGEPLPGHRCARHLPGGPRPGHDSPVGLPVPHRGEPGLDAHAPSAADRLPAGGPHSVDGPRLAGSGPRGGGRLRPLRRLPEPRLVARPRGGAGRPDGRLPRLRHRQPSDPLPGADRVAGAHLRHHALLPLSYPASQLPGWARTVHEWLPFEPMAQVVRAGLCSQDAVMPARAWVVLGVWSAASLAGASWALGRRS